MSAYDELVERAAQKAICAQMESGKPLWVFLADHNKNATDLYGPIRAALAEVFRTLETVTPEMARALDNAAVPSGIALAAWLTMLGASPLAAAAEKERET